MNIELIPENIQGYDKDQETRIILTFDNSLVVRASTKEDYGKIVDIGIKAWQESSLKNHLII